MCFNVVVPNKTCIDYLVIGNYLYKKKEQYRAMPSRLDASSLYQKLIDRDYNYQSNPISRMTKIEFSNIH